MHSATAETTTALEVKLHPIQSDNQKLRRITAAYPFQAAYLVGRFPTPGFTDFIWGMCYCAGRATSLSDIAVSLPSRMTVNLIVWPTSV